ncbi:3,4-dihydroxy-2-butanone-4-phosphate synthase [Consotaella aegiceratis]|uniref:3,4-dihydroxy-2-butanone-4-phosphate synthase n=1 Tax=Consotaella aegiceratis TaxID=3097961 RepID=UPI002F421F18
MQLDNIEAAVAAIAAGEPVVVVDDADRENEGDLIMAASAATAETMGFIVRHTSGIVCVPMTAERARRLNLPPMVATNLDPMRTAFTISVDYKIGMTTGIAADERANTARALASGKAQASDFLRPGHVFPLIARVGGVLARSGHTEAATDLAHLAGLPSVGILAEIVHDDGSLQRLPDLAVFTNRHGLKIISIEDLIAYRLRRESLLRCVKEETVAISDLTGRARIYQTPFDPLQHLAFTFGDISSGRDIPTHIHRERPIAELVGQMTAARSWLDAASAHIRTAGKGILVFLRTARLDERPYQESVQTGSYDVEQHGRARARMQRWRETGLGAQILRDLGVRSIEALGAPGPYTELSGYGIEVTGVAA